MSDVSEASRLIVSLRLHLSRADAVEVIVRAGEVAGVVPVTVRGLFVEFIGAGEGLGFLAFGLAFWNPNLRYVRSLMETYEYVWFRGSNNEIVRVIVILTM